MNYPSYVRNFQPSNVIEHNGDLVVDRQRLDPLTSRSIATRTVLRDGAVRQEPSASRVHTFPELRDWLRAAGFATVDGYGEDGAALTAEHRRQDRKRVVKGKRVYVRVDPGGGGHITKKKKISQNS